MHLGGSYWQRASFDAVVVIAALLGLVLVAPAVRRFRPRHWATTALLAVAVSIFGVALVDSFNYADRLLIRIQVIERRLSDGDGAHLRAAGLHLPDARHDGHARLGRSERSTAVAGSCPAAGGAAIP